MIRKTLNGSKQRRIATERLAKYVTKHDPLTDPDGCDFWTGGVDKYGQPTTIHVGGGSRNTLPATVATYELWHGFPVPEGSVIRRECNTKACMRPDHLVAVPSVRPDWKTSSHVVADGIRAMNIRHKRMAILTRGTDGWINAEVPSLPGCVSQGRTWEEAKENIAEAMRFFLAILAEEGRRVPPPIPSTIVTIDIEE